MEFNLEQYLSVGVQNIVTDALKATLNNPKQTAFFMQYALATRKAEKLRAAHEKQGQHIPSFLIGSITQDCNLHCTGCYANQSHSQEALLSDEDWARLFAEATTLGVSLFLLAGGEPLLRPNVIAQAAKHTDILFPIFTNGTMLTADVLPMFDKHRNLVPMLSIEGNEEQTDNRRGSGVYAQLMNVMAALTAKSLVFGASVTVTTQNLYYVTSPAFTNQLQEKGCKAIVFVEYVPVEERQLALDDTGREVLAARIASLRENAEGLMLISFPGDEKASNGCLAAGRGFFHINANGGAEPCPFSPFSDTNLKQTTLLQALQSPLFTKLSTSGLLTEDHTGGCLLFERQDTVKALMK